MSEAADGVVAIDGGGRGELRYSASEVVAWCCPYYVNHEVRGVVSVGLSPALTVISRDLHLRVRLLLKHVWVLFSFL